MNRTLNTLAIAFLLVAAVGVTTASASEACVKVGDQYFRDGVLVAKSDCKESKAMKRVSDWAPTHTDKCNGKPNGHTYLAVGPDGKRLAQYRCR